MRFEPRNEAKSMNQLILYPRNALAADQYNEFKTMASYVNKALQLAQRPHLLGVAIDSDGKVKTKRKGGKRAVCKLSTPPR